MPLQNKGLILLTVLAVAALSIIACKTPGDSDYDTRADTEQIALLRGRKILLLPIQYTTKNLRLAPVVYKDTASGVEEPDAASIKQILGYQAAAIKRHFQPMFSVENADENDSRL